MGSGLSKIERALVVLGAVVAPIGACVSDADASVAEVSYDAIDLAGFSASGGGIEVDVQADIVNNARAATVGMTLEDATEDDFPLGFGVLSARGQASGAIEAGETIPFAYDFEVEWGGTGVGAGERLFWEVEVFVFTSGSRLQFAASGEVANDGSGAPIRVADMIELTATEAADVQRWSMGMFVDWRDQSSASTLSLRVPGDGLALGVVPAPGAAAVLSATGIVTARRRRGSAMPR